MPEFKDILLGVALSAGLCLPAFAQTAETGETTSTAPAAVSSGTVIATVNGADITLGHLIASIRDLSPQEQNLPSEVLFNGLIERTIQQAAVISPDAEVSGETALRLDNARRELLAGARVEALAAEIEIGDADLQAAYDARYADFTPSREYNASHILVATEQEARSIIEDLAGGTDFADLAKEKSTGPSGPGGGELGWFGAGRMVPSFEAAVVAMQPGEVSEPVQTQFGWHVIKLNDTRIPEVPALTDVGEELRAEIFRQELIARIDAEVAKAEIVRSDISGIDPKVLRDPSLLAD